MLFGMKRFGLKAEMSSLSRDPDSGEEGSWAEGKIGGSFRFEAARGAWRAEVRDCIAEALAAICPLSAARFKLFAEPGDDTLRALSASPP